MFEHRERWLQHRHVDQPEEVLTALGGRRGGCRDRCRACRLCFAVVPPDRWPLGLRRPRWNGLRRPGPGARSGYVGTSTAAASRRMAAATAAAWRSGRRRRTRGCGGRDPRRSSGSGRTTGRDGRHPRRPGRHSRSAGRRGRHSRRTVRRGRTAGRRRLRSRSRLRRRAGHRHPLISSAQRVTCRRWQILMQLDPPPSARQSSSPTP